MTGRELRSLLDGVDDTREIVLRREATLGPAWTALLDVWREARDECAQALQLWALTHAADEYAVYRAAQDREDAAQDALAAALL